MSVNPEALQKVSICCGFVLVFLFGCTNMFVAPYGDGSTTTKE